METYTMLQWDNPLEPAAVEETLKIFSNSKSHIFITLPAHCRLLYTSDEWCVETKAGMNENINIRVVVQPGKENQASQQCKKQPGERNENNFYESHKILRLFYVFFAVGCRGWFQYFFPSNSTFSTHRRRCRCFC